MSDWREQRAARYSRLADVNGKLQTFQWIHLGSEADTIAGFYAPRVAGQIQEGHEIEKSAGLSEPYSARLPWSAPVAVPRDSA